MKLIGWILSFAIPFIGVGGAAAMSVGKHLTKAAYPGEEIQLGAGIFFLVAGFAAGVSGLYIRRVLQIPEHAFRWLLVQISFMAVGSLFAYVTLSDFYDNPSGHVWDWAWHTGVAFTLFGLLPATIAFVLAVRSSSASLDASSSPPSSASAHS